MTHKKRLHGLVISWFYPPGNSSEGLVTYKLLKNSDFTYDVFTRKTHDENVWDRDVDETALTATNVRIIPASTNDKDKWIQEAIDFFAEHAKEYDFVMSRIMPPAAHEAAVEIKRKFPNVVWIASFGDPLVDPLSYDIVSRDDTPFTMRAFYRQNWASPRNLLSRKKRLEWEKLGVEWEQKRQEEMKEVSEMERLNRAVFDGADLLIFNNPYQFKRAFVDDYAAYKTKGALIPHTFDETLYQNTTKPKQDKKVHFVYTGHLDARRNIRALLHGIALLGEHCDNLKNRVQFDFYGHVDENDKKLISELKLNEIVYVHEAIGYLESLQKISEADWALLVDANLNSKMQEYVYLPAKLIDYIGAKKGIFAITHRAGASADVVNQLMAGQVVTHTAEEIALYLAKILYQGYDPVNYNESGRQEYNAKTVAKAMDKEILRVLEKTER